MSVIGTPGPWQSHSDEDYLTIIGDIDGPDNGSYTYTTIAEVEPGDRAEANARLIVAAPDLLDALLSLRIAAHGSAALKLARIRADRVIAQLGL